ncbi:MAG: sigma-70 family RNA polymerase sigma factor [Pseudomonadota bacterium]
MSDDRTIVQQVLDGRPGAFERLVARHERLVWHIVLRMAGNEADAGDLVQETFLRVFRKLGQYRFDAKLATWIGRVAYSVALRFLERRRPEVTLLDDQEFVSDDPGPERLAEAANAESSVALAMQALAPIPRTIVSLFHLQDLSIEEIAAVTGLPAGTVKSHLFRARRKMRRALDAAGVGL